MVRISQRSSLLLAAGVIGGVLVAGGVAFAGSALAENSPSPSASPSASTPGSPPGSTPGSPPGSTPGSPRDRKPGGGFGHGFGMLGGRALHGEIVLEQEDGSGTEVVLCQRGTVTAKTGTTLTVRSTDGFQVSWKVTDDTRVRSADGDGLAAIAVDDDVTIGGPKTSDGGTASLVVELGSPGQLRERFGRGWRSGHGDARPGDPSERSPQGSSTTAATA